MEAGENWCFQQSSKLSGGLWSLVGSIPTRFRQIYKIYTTLKILDN